MGSVWAARNELTNRDFAVKFLLPELSRNAEALNRFFLEARACGQIRHASIVDVYDMGQAEDGSPYLVMELLEGEGFDHRLSRQGRMRAVDVCRYVATVARGLEEAHMRGLVHRDLKPGNIFFAIDKSGEVLPKVLDFGISKETNAEQFDFVRTGTGAVLGSPAYMSPEQARGELDIDARTDIWALGVIMYEALTGEIPFDANNYNALMLRIITQDHTKVHEHAPEVPLELSQLVDQLLDKERDKRIHSAGELAERLERIYAKLTQTPLSRPERMLSVPPPAATMTQQGWLASTGPGRGRVSVPLVVGAMLALMGIVGGGIALSQASAGTVMPAARVSASVGALVARAETQFTEAVSEVKAEAAEKAAEQRVEAARQSDAPAQPPAGGFRRPPPHGKDVHGGVDGPGF
jgi:serine/threonine-protein kinase